MRGAIKLKFKAHLILEFILNILLYKLNLAKATTFKFRHTQSLLTKLFMLKILALGTAPH